MKLLSPDQYSQASVYELLEAAAMGRVGIDRRWLHAIVDRGRDAVADLVRFAGESRDDDRFEIRADLLALFRHLRTPEALPFYFKYGLEFEGDEFPEDLMEAFLDLGEQSIEPLLALRADIEDSWNITMTLAALQVRDPRILEALLDELKRDPADGAIALSHYGDPAAIPALEQARRELPPGNEETAGEIDRAIEALREPGREPEPREPYSIWNEDRDRYPDEADPGFSALPDEELIEFLDSPVPDYRADALNMLAFDGLAAEYVPRVLEIARTDAEVSVRAEAWQALSNSLGEPGVEPALRAVVGDASKPIAERAGALIGLADRVADDPGLHAATLEFFKAPGVRPAAVRAMWQSGDRSFASSIPAALKDADPAVRREAIAAVGWFDMSAEAAHLPELFDDEDLREPALLAYGLAGGTAKVTPETAGRFLDRVDELAGGLSEEESHLVMSAINARLQKQGYEPAFVPEEDDDCGDPDCAHHHRQEHEAAPQPARVEKIGRNDPCPCGSGKKYKKCCGQ
jgi:HEAT repeat protein